MLVASQGSAAASSVRAVRAWHVAAVVAAADRAVEEEVQKVRLKNIHLANALKKLEATIR
jgi:hypothetical protein